MIFLFYRGADLLGNSLHRRRLPAHRPGDGLAGADRRARQVGVGEANRQFGRRSGADRAAHAHLRLGPRIVWPLGCRGARRRAADCYVDSDTRCERQNMRFFVCFARV
jgi:hypothetical protein